MTMFSIVGFNSTIVESYFSQGSFAVWRNLWDYTIGFSPIPLIYIFLLVLLFLLVRWIRRLKREYVSFPRLLWQIIKGFALTCCTLYAFFYITWGFNYKRVDQIDQLLDSSYVQKDEDALFQEFERVSSALSQLRSSMPDSVDWHTVISGDDDLYRPYLVETFRSLEVPHTGRVRVRMLYPKGSLLYWSTAGVYLPFVSEGHVDAGLHPIAWPFTILHEMSHGYGQTGEDDCNFWALLACINSDEPIVQYSGHMAYWRYIRSNAYRADGERYRAVMETVHPLVIKDLKEIIAYGQRYPDIMPKLRDLFYDQYLKSNGISEGLLSYSRVVSLAMSWQEKFGTLELESSTEGE